MSSSLNAHERKLLEILDDILRDSSSAAAIDSIVKRGEQKLVQRLDAVMAWEPVPLDLYRNELPAEIRSSWVFILRSNATTGAERHPNSHQRMMSYRGSGDFQVMSGDRWESNFLVSDPGTPLQSRWISIPPDTWHQAVVPGQNWVVVSFHTALQEELIEERPRPNDTNQTDQRKYLNK